VKWAKMASNTITTIRTLVGSDIMNSPGCMTYLFFDKNSLLGSEISEKFTLYPVFSGTNFLDLSYSI
jgi:uncharacterized membrane protein